MRLPRLALSALLALGAAGCAAKPTRAPAEPASWSVDHGAEPFEEGRASYYSDRLAGHPTAGGEPYDPSDLTAAHRSLPFGSVVDVARPDGRHVTVRINDRGPYARGRIIDLSRSAAVAIGLVRDGVAEVALRLVSTPAERHRRRRAQ